MKKNTIDADGKDCKDFGESTLRIEKTLLERFLFRRASIGVEETIYLARNSRSSRSLERIARDCFDKGLITLCGVA